MPEPSLAALCLVSFALPSPAAQGELEPSAAVPSAGAALVSVSGAVDAACAWLLAHQDDDGRWDADAFMKHDGFGAEAPGALDDDAFWRGALGVADGVSENQRLLEAGPGDPNVDVGVTALALRALVADGRAVSGAPGREDLLRGLDWLVAQQNDTTGLIAVPDGVPVGIAFHYGHAIATLALAETLQALGSDESSRANAYRASLASAVAYIERARNPYGAWRYDSPPVGENDTSVTVWMALALLAAEDAGAEVDEEAIRGARSWFEEVTDLETGRVGYVERGSRSSRVPGMNDFMPQEGAESLTAGALLARLRMGDQPRKEPELVDHVRLVLKALGATAATHVQDAIWMNWGTGAMAEIQSLPWEEWAQGATPIVMGTQARDGAYAGSWAPSGAWGYQLGRVGATALLSHSLSRVDANGGSSLAFAVIDPAIGTANDSTGSESSDRGHTAAGVEESIALGLEWLASHQDPDGRWNADGFMAHDPEDARSDGAGMAVHDVGVTALALMAFLGSGETPATGEHKNAVARGLAWLVKSQDPETGLLGEEVGHAFMYDHALGALALSEFYLLTKDASLKPVAQKALNFIARARNPYGVWRYSVPPDGDNDTSLTAWVMQALRSGEDAGLKVDRESWSAAMAWLDEMTDPKNGRIGYTERGSTSSRVPGMNVDFDVANYETLTAAGLFTRFLGGQGANGPTDVMQLHAGLLETSLKSLRDRSVPVDLYALYYSSRAMYQMGGDHWSAWTPAIRAAVIETQRQDGSARGSWSPDGPWGYAGGRVYSTAMMLLSAQMVKR